MWALTKGTANIMGLGAFNAVPLVLVTRNANVKTIVDFSEKDRIALPGVLNSTQAIVLQMAAEKLWGPGQHKRLDALTISRGHPDALAALLADGNEITAHFAAPPYDRMALAAPGVRRCCHRTTFTTARAPTVYRWPSRRFATPIPKPCGRWWRR